MARTHANANYKKSFTSNRNHSRTSPSRAPESIELKQTSDPYRKQMEIINICIKSLKYKQQNVQSLAKVLIEEIKNDHFPASPVPNVKRNDVAYVLINKNDNSTAYTDLTGRFSMRSSRGNQYILVGYHYGGNCIYVKAVKDRKAVTLTAAWEQLHKYLQKQTLHQTHMSWTTRFQTN